jgi:hypothetical protein
MPGRDHAHVVDRNRRAHAHAARERVLRDDVADVEEERRVLVAQAGEVEQQLLVPGSDDRFVEVESVDGDGPGPHPARRAPGGQQRQQDCGGDQPAVPDRMDPQPPLRPPLENAHISR